MTRSDWILLALRAEIDRRRELIDGDLSIKEVILMLQFPAGQGHVGAVRSKFEHAPTLVKLEELDKPHGV